MLITLRDEGTCPVCEGACVVPGPKYVGKADSGTRPCTNCGGQYMFGTPRGKVPLRYCDGSPCTHSYKAASRQSIYRTIHTSECEHCGDTWTSDSGD